MICLECKAWHNKEGMDEHRIKKVLESWTDPEYAHIEMSPREFKMVIALQQDLINMCVLWGDLMEKIISQSNEKDVSLKRLIASI